MVITRAAEVQAFELHHYLQLKTGATGKFKRHWQLAKKVQPQMLKVDRQSQLATPTYLLYHLVPKALIMAMPC